MPRADGEAITQRFLDNLDEVPAPMSLLNPLLALSLYSHTFLKRLVGELAAAGLVSSRTA